MTCRCSSVGQSACLVSRGSSVQIRAPALARDSPYRAPCRSGEVRSRTALRAYAWCVATHLHIAHRGYRTGLGDNTIAQAMAQLLDSPAAELRGLAARLKPRRIVLVVGPETEMRAVEDAARAAAFHVIDSTLDSVRQ